MTYQHLTENCFAEAIGDGGLKRSESDSYLQKTAAGLAGLKQQYDEGTLPLLRLPEQRDDLKACTSVADHLLHDTTDLVLLGTGGSSLGAQALAQITGYATPAFEPPKGAPRFHFFDNLDPVTMAKALETLDLAKTRFLIVSKSGGTAETMIQALAAMTAIDRAGGAKYMKQHFAAITEPKDNPLRRLGESVGFPLLEHNPGVGGRFSALTNVGLLPAMLMGLDPVAIREGAASVLQPVLDGAAPEDVPAAVGAAISVGLAEERGVWTSVLMPYADRLEKLAMWYRQLWAESLGKDGKGTTPVKALGPVDQHSQVQLYLAGPRDKMFTVMMTDVKGKGPKADASLAGDDALDYLDGKTVGDLVDAEQRATAETLARNGRPTRVIKLDAVNEHGMGALMMHFFLETIIAAHIWDVDPYDQPAVEEGKVLAKKYLGAK